VVALDQVWVPEFASRKQLLEPEGPDSGR